MPEDEEKPIDTSKWPKDKQQAIKKFHEETEELTENFQRDARDFLDDPAVPKEAKVEIQKTLDELENK